MNEGGPPILDRRIGRIVSVSGAQVVCLLEDEDGQGEPLAMQVGTVVKMPTARSVAYGMVRAVSIPVPSADRGEPELRVLELELLGEIVTEPGASGWFERGVSVSPGLGSDIWLADPEDLRRVYACSSGSTARIGTVHLASTLPANIKTDDLLGKHFAVLGTTGSGKSCAVTVILKAILREHQQARILLLDPHDEYAQAFGDAAVVLDPTSSLELPYWLLNFDELCEVVIGEDDLKSAQATLLAEAIVTAKTRLLGTRASYPVTVDTPTPYWVADVVTLLQQSQGRLARPEALPAFGRLINRLKALSNDSRYGFMFGPAAAGDRMTEILADLFRIPIEGQPITIVDLSAVPSEILNVVVSVLCRLTIDFALWSDAALPIMIVCEEAHRYAPAASGVGFEPTKRALARIAKEGRKYGVSLCVVSQRPSDLAPEMLSECNTIFALRMTNQTDQEFVRAAMSESGLGLLEFLPSLRTGEAIAVGEGVPVPLRLGFDPLPAQSQPRGKTAAFSAAWSREPSGVPALPTIIDRWRRRQR